MQNKIDLALIKKRLASRRFRRTSGLIWFFIGLLVLLDSPYHIPVPLTGLASVIVSSVILAKGVLDLYRGLVLPIDEVLLYLKYKKEPTDYGEILDFLEGEGGNGEQLLQVLEKRDLAGRLSRSLEYVQSHEQIPENMISLFPAGEKRLNKRLLHRLKFNG